MEGPLTNSSILNETFTLISTELPTTHRGRSTMDGPGDAVWILTSAFIIFTMISGFGLVESGKFNLNNIQAIFLNKCFTPRKPTGLY